jgi:hypothetical protein
VSEIQDVPLDVMLAEIGRLRDENANLNKVLVETAHELIDCQGANRALEEELRRKM